jgi:CubicO group peptidase (beta-lactamase class C family)
MDQTQVDDRFAIITYRTRFSEKTESGTMRNAEFLDSSYKIPGGGWLSSAQDMARFEVAILNDTLIHPSTRDLMWTALKPSDGSADLYALGWGWREQKPGEALAIGHSRPYQHGKPARQRTSPGDSEHPDCAIRKETLTLKPV